MNINLFIFLSSHIVAVLRSHSHNDQDRQASTSSSTHTYATARLQKYDAQVFFFLRTRRGRSCQVSHVIEDLNYELGHAYRHSSTTSIA